MYRCALELPQGVLYTVCQWCQLLGLMQILRLTSGVGPVPDRKLIRQEPVLKNMLVTLEIDVGGGIRVR